MPSPLRFPLIAGLLLTGTVPSPAAEHRGAAVGDFQQLGELLPSPTPQRNAAGAPGPAYWQNRADYRIEASLDEKTHRLAGRAVITYHNASPDPLAYLWLQLDPNHFAADAASRALAPAPDPSKFPYRTLQEMLVAENYSSNLAVRDVRDAAGRPLWSGDPAAARPLLTALAAWRAQRCVSLL